MPAIRARPAGPVHPATPSLIPHTGWAFLRRRRSVPSGTEKPHGAQRRKTPVRVRSPGKRKTRRDAVPGAPKGRSPGRHAAAAQLARFALTAESFIRKRFVFAPTFGENPLRLKRPARRTGTLRAAPPRFDSNALRSARQEARQLLPRWENPGPACRRGSAVRAVGPVLLSRLCRAPRANSAVVPLASVSVVFNMVSVFGGLGGRVERGHQAPGVGESSPDSS